MISTIGKLLVGFILGILGSLLANNIYTNYEYKNLANSLYTQAIEQYELGNNLSAIQKLDEAYVLAKSIKNDNLMALYLSRKARLLLFTAKYYIDKPELVKQSLSAIKQSVNKFNKNDKSTEHGIVLNDYGLALLAKAQVDHSRYYYNQSELSFDKAINIFKANKDQLNLINSTINKGIAICTKSQTNQSIHELEAGIKILKSAANNASSHLINSSYIKANAFLQLGAIQKIIGESTNSIPELNNAKSNLKKALKLFIEQKNAYWQNVTKNELGLTYQQLARLGDNTWCDLVKSKYYFELAIDFFSTKDKYKMDLINATNNMIMSVAGMSHSNSSNKSKYIDKAIKDLKKLEELSSSVNSITRKAILYHNIGESYYNLYRILGEKLHGNLVESSIKYLSRSNALFELTGNSNSRADIYYILGDLYYLRAIKNRKIKYIDNAIFNYQKAANIITSAFHKKKKAYIFIKMGDLELFRNIINKSSNKKQAFTYYRKAEEIYRDIHDDEGIKKINELREQIKNDKAIVAFHLTFDAPFEEKDCDEIQK